MANQTDCAVVLAQLEVSLFGQGDKGLGPLSWPYPCSPNLITEVGEDGNHCCSFCLNQFAWEYCQFLLIFIFSVMQLLLQLPCVGSNASHFLSRLVDNLVVLTHR